MRNGKIYLAPNEFRKKNLAVKGLNMWKNRANGIKRRTETSTRKAQKEITKERECRYDIENRCRYGN